MGTYEGFFGEAVDRIGGEPIGSRMARKAPIRHVDPVGTILLPGILIITAALGFGSGVVFGYAKPVPIDASKMRNPRHQLLAVSLAGPLTFSDRQRSFLADCAPTPVDLDSLVALGPVDACGWRVHRHGFTVDVQRLQVAGSPAVLELSVVVPLADAPFVRHAFDAVLRRHGLDPAAESRTAVEIVLEQLLRSA